MLFLDGRIERIITFCSDICFFKFQNSFYFLCLFINRLFICFFYARVVQNVLILFKWLGLFEKLILSILRWCLWRGMYILALGVLFISLRIIIFCWLNLPFYVDFLLVFGWIWIFTWKGNSLLDFRKERINWKFLIINIWYIFLLTKLFYFLKV